MSRRRALTTLASLIGFGVLLILDGCGPIKVVTSQNRSAPVTQPAKAVEQHLSAVTVEHSAARSDIATVTKAPTLPPALLPPLQSADRHIVVAQERVQAATTQMSALDKAAAQWAEKDLATQSALAKAQNEINRLNSQFFSPRQKRDFWFLFGVTAFYAIVTGCLKMFGGTVPALATVYHLLLIPLTLGFSLFHAIGQGLGKFVHWLAEKLAARVAALKTAAAATPAPAK